MAITMASGEKKLPDGSDWEEDMQYRSMALDRKIEAEDDFGKFIAEHPDVKAICSDFLKHMLLFKPDDVLAEADSYFSNFRNPPSPKVTSSKAEKAVLVTENVDPKDDDAIETNVTIADESSVVTSSPPKKDAESNLNMMAVEKVEKSAP